MKKNGKILAAIASMAVVLTIAIVVFFNVRNTPAIPLEQSETEFSIESETPMVAKPAAAVKEIKPAETETTIVIPEASATDTLPTPSVTETKTESGDTVQQPNWDAQKELKSGTDLEDPDNEPEYVGTPSKPPVVHEESKTTSETSSTTSTTTTAPKTTSSSSTPQNGTEKLIDGQNHIYVEGFGWVKSGSGNQGTVVDVGELSGEKVGY